MPGLQVLAGYQRGWFSRDFVAGVVVATMLIPVGVAYAEASGVPGINGLYATMIPLVAYAVLGPSRIFILAPDSALTAVILAVVLSHSGGDPDRAVALAALMAIVSGLACIVVGLLRLGFLTELLSKPIRYGYMNGIALTVLISQLPKLFDVSIESAGPLRNLWSIGREIAAGRANWITFAVGLAAMGVILLLRRFPRVPGVLVAVVAASLAVAVLGLDDAAGVKMLGALQQGLPSFAVPWVGLADLRAVLLGGCAAALISVADTGIFSRVLAARSRTWVDPNHEIVALGATNLMTGVFQGFPVTSSASRTAVAESTGAKTQVAAVVAASMVALVLVLAPSLMRYVPVSALAAVVITAAIGLFELADLRRIYRIQRWEFWLSIVCFVGVATFGAIPGIGLSIGIAIAEFLWDAWRPHSAVLGRAEGVRGFHDIQRYPDAERVPGLVLFRWDAPLFFANAELFQQRVMAAVGSSPTPVRRVVVAAEPVTDVDVTSADMLTDLERTLRESGIELHFAEMKDPVKDKLKRLELFECFKPACFHPTVGAAVDAYVAVQAVNWKP